MDNSLSSPTSVSSVNDCPLPSDLGQYSKVKRTLNHHMDKCPCLCTMDRCVTAEIKDGLPIMGEDVEANVKTPFTEKTTPSTEALSDRTAHVDGPWSIVVGAAAFFAMMILGGLCYTGGLYYVYFKSTFEASSMATSWLCSMGTVGWLVGSPVGSILVNRWGYRNCSFLGGLFSGVGLSLCMIATNFYTLFLFYGIIACIANGIQFMGFMTAIHLYFNKHRARVQILIFLGASLGMSVYSVLIPYLIEHYGWRGSLLIQGAVSFHVCAFATVLFPVPSPKETKKKHALKVSILLNSSFFVFCIHVLLMSITSTMVIIHLPPLMISKDLGLTTASLALVVFGISNCGGHFLYSIFLRERHVIVIYTLSLLVGGVVSLCLSFISTVIGAMVCVAVVGFTYNVLGGLVILITLELVGQKNVVDGIGINYLFRAIGGVSAGPLAGILYDLTLDYKVVFYLAGAGTVLSCCILIPIIVARARRHVLTSRHQLTFSIPADGDPCKDVLVSKPCQRPDIADAESVVSKYLHIIAASYSNMDLTDSQSEMTSSQDDEASLEIS